MKQTSKPITVAEIMRLASERADTRRKAHEASQEYTARDRAWFRKPLGALALVIALAIGGTAHAAPHADSPAVAHAKQEIADGRAKLKAARASERAANKLAHKAQRIAKLKASIAKLESPEAK